MIKWSNSLINLIIECGTFQPCNVTFAGLTKVDLKERRLTGTHCCRHWGAEASGHLRWPNKDRAVSGDWVPAPEPEEGDEAAPVRMASRKSRRTMPETYAPNATRADQVAVRGRLFASARVALSLYELDNELSWDTTWENLYPVEPNLVLLPYYGKRAPAAKAAAAVPNPNKDRAKRPRN